MIKVDGDIVNINSFPDGTMLLKYKQGEDIWPGVPITWKYENDREFLALIYLVNHLRSHGVKDIYLYMPYIPNARQDRVKGPEDVFTLKYFAELLNSLNLTRVEVLDPHSTVSEALIDNLMVISPRCYIEDVLGKIMPNLRKIHEPDVDVLMFYPDEGAMKRYSDGVGLPYAFGIKKRNWETGKIEGLDVAGAVDQIAGKDILIVGELED